MTDTFVVLVTCENQEQAVRIAHAVVEEKLAACVNVLPAIRSCYVWEEKLHWSDEVLLIVKTARTRFAALRDRILELHSYEVPEIVAMPIEEGLPKYLDWIDAAVQNSQ